MSTASKYYPTLWRIARSEFTKMWSLNSIRWNAIIGVVFPVALTALVVGVMTSPFLVTEPRDPDSIQSTAAAFHAVAIIFVCCMGSLSVTTEYANNTMRTTLLAEPRRNTAMMGKILGVGAGLTVFSLIFKLLSVIVIWIISTPPTIANGMLWLHISTVIMPVIIGLLAMGVGYLVRSSAASILLTFVLVFLSNILEVIPWAFLRHYLMPFTPASAMSASLAPLKYGLRDVFLLVPPQGILAQSWTPAPIFAFVIIAGWAVLLLLLGNIRYRMSDA